jgi:septal ring factor EnvC (AmiA/AmiB activator)
MIEEVRTWSGPIASLLAIASLIYTWFTARSKINEQRLSGHERKLTEHDRRVQKLENDVSHLPSKDDVHELRLEVSSIKGSIGRLEASSAATDRTARRIEEFLMKEGGR